MVDIDCSLVTVCELLSQLWGHAMQERLVAKAAAPEIRRCADTCGGWIEWDDVIVGVLMGVARGMWDFGVGQLLRTGWMGWMAGSNRHCTRAVSDQG